MATEIKKTLKGDEFVKAVLGAESFNPTESNARFLRQAIQSVRVYVEDAFDSDPMFGGAVVHLRNAQGFAGKIIGANTGETPYKNDGKRSNMADVEPLADGLTLRDAQANLKKLGFAGSRKADLDVGVTTADVSRQVLATITSNVELIADSSKTSPKIARLLTSLIHELNCARLSLGWYFEDRRQMMEAEEVVKSKTKKSE